MTNAQRLADARRRVHGLRAALQQTGRAVVGYPKSVIAEDMKLLGLTTLTAEPSRAGDDRSVTRHEQPPPNSNQRNISMRYSTLQRVAASHAARAADGFANFGDFLIAVRKSASGQRDPRLAAAATTLTKTGGVGIDGGFAVPVRYQEQIGNIIQAETSLLALCDVYGTEGNSFNSPTDESTPWGGTGITARWTGEGAAAQQSKVALRNVSAKLAKLEALVPVTEELATDAPALVQYLERKTPEAIDYEISKAIVRGTGGATPLGVLNSPALVTVDKESAQAADTIVAGNINKMFGRLPASSFANAVWLANPDALPQLPALNAGGANLFAWAPGMPMGIVGLLLGIPVIPHQACSTVGDFGDILLVDLSKYLAAVKIGGTQVRLSTHIWFDLDVYAYAFGIRVLGQPWPSAPIAPRVGTMTQSPFVALAARD